MCSLCNYKNYELKENNKGEKYLEQNLGITNIKIKCDINGKNYKIIDSENKEYKIYRCFTCGKILPD